MKSSKKYYFKYRVKIVFLTRSSNNNAVIVIIIINGSFNSAKLRRHIECVQRFVNVAFGSRKDSRNMSLF